MNEVPLSLLNIANHNLSDADYQYECLKRAILDFQCSLDDEHEIAFLLPGLGSEMPFFVEAVTYENPTMLIFYGNYNGNASRLIQNISQLSFLMMSVPKKDPEQAPRRIGFATD